MRKRKFLSFGILFALLPLSFAIQPANGGSIYNVTLTISRIGFGTDLESGDTNTLYLSLPNGGTYLLGSRSKGIECGEPYVFSQTSTEYIKRRSCEILSFSYSITVSFVMVLGDSFHIELKEKDFLAYDVIFDAKVKVTGTGSFKVHHIPDGYKTSLNGGDVVLSTDVNLGEWTEADFINCQTDDGGSNGGTSVISVDPSTPNYGAPSCASVLTYLPYLNYIYFSYSVSQNTGLGGGGGPPPVFSNR
ncbi:MAG: hypothetical protein D6732_21620 [Methanobacteriota archaeon]|nr:MAG: hypothetical protein D6732_21620 [Euryarchaeota archaeon]